MSNQATAAALQAVREGDLRRADILTSQVGSSDLSTLALRCEILFLSGYSDRASALSTELLPRLADRQDLRAQVLFILGACAWELGDEKRGRERLEKAEVHAKACGNWPLVSRVRLQILERSSSSGAPYHLSLPLCSAAVRAVHRSGDRQIRADAHITFARLEARGGAIVQATRHLHHANRLLIEQPNKWMAASAKLTYAMILAHQGDVESACEQTQRASTEAADAGWMKGEAIAAANLAFFHVNAGRLRQAEESLARAEQIGYQSPSYTYAVRDTKIALAVASRILRRPIACGPTAKRLCKAWRHGTSSGLATLVSERYSAKDEWQMRWRLPRTASRKQRTSRTNT